MSEVADLVVAIGGLIGSMVSAYVLLRSHVDRKREPRRVAKRAASSSAAAFLDALADGQITPDEVEELRRALEDEDGEP
ncbi:hypothetical protein [Prauserella cavernicola]|uniref:SHOCT domain-containing protein n=1 Tax=Prauserella cavernicola TaxID=2800127 RepID=A0A934V5Z3_9PSEU|nr:hypothetical protein [Prauserella cavernicola]MBK1785143.1 hypothetical protein [Prauserella cavernicola]